MANLTLLRASKNTGKTLTKVEDGYTVSVAGKLWLFDVIKHNVDGIDSLVKVLKSASDQPRLVAIMDDLKDGVSPKGVLRRSINFDKGVKPFLFLDLDKLPFAEPDIALAGEKARALLPPEFHGVRCGVQATSQHMIPGIDKDGIPVPARSRLRLYFYLDEDITSAQARQWAKRASTKIDASLFASVHVTYLAGPTFLDGHDPFPERWVMLDGAANVIVPIDLDAVAATVQARLRVAPEGVPENSSRAVADFIALIDREFDAKVATGRRNLFRNWANDAFDRNINESLVEAIFIGAVAGEDIDAKDALEQELRDLKIESPALAADRIHHLAARTADRWEEGDGIDLGDSIRRGIDEAPGYRHSPFGCWFNTISDGSEFGSRDAPLLTAEESAPPQHLLDARENLKAEKAKVKKKLDRRHTPLNSITFKVAVDTACDDLADPLIDDVLNKRTMGIIYGDSGSGKTFVALSMADAVATGTAWNGHETHKGLVIYVAAEAGPTIKPRLAALHKANPDLDRTLFVTVTDPIDLRDADEVDLKRLRAKIAEIAGSVGQPAVLVILDTFSRVMAGGDENSPVDMGRMVYVFDSLKDEFAAAIVIVHHTGKDAARGARGHSLLRAATDTEIECKAEQQADSAGKSIHVGKLTVTKERSGPLGLSHDFKLAGCAIGQTSRGKPVTSATVVWLGAGSVTEKPRAKVEELSPVLLDVYEGLVEVMAHSTAGYATVQEVRPLAGGRTEQVVRNTLSDLVVKGLAVRVAAGRYALAPERRVMAAAGGGSDDPYTAPERD